MKISLVVVCHHSSRVLSRCVESFRREAAASAVEAEIVAVEHSEDGNETELVRKVGVDRLLERPNRGYAAGLNAGAQEATGEVLLLANPDISFFPGSVGALLAGIRRGYDVVGPQFAWDDEGLVLLPAAEDPSPRAEFGRALRLRSPWLWSASLSRTLDQTWRFWTADETVPVGGLRGALLGVPKEALTRFGPFDEGYFLYYEETEWLWRARRRGARLGLAADAKVQHRWGHATGQSEGAAEREETSRRRFVTRNYGAIWRRILRAGGGVDRRSPIVVERLEDSASVPSRMADLWLASPFPHLLPALGSVRTETMPSSFLDFCRTWRWVVGAAARNNGRWQIDGAWTWGS
jgi:GT2 family glycosyltransferase